MAAKAIDDATKTMLEDHVKKGKVRKFILICKGAAIQTLIVFKKGPYGTQLMAAKKAGFRGQAYCGVITGKGKSLTMQLPGNSEVAKIMKADGGGCSGDPCKIAKLRSFFSDEAGLAFKPEFDIVTLPEKVLTAVEQDEGEADAETPELVQPAPTDPAGGGTATAEEPPAPTGAPSGGPDEGLRAQLAAGLKKLSTLILQAIEAQPAEQQKVMDQVAAVKDLIKGDDLEVAKQKLVEFGTALKGIVGAAAAAAGEVAAAVGDVVEKTANIAANVEEGEKLFSTKGSKFAELAGSDKLTVPQQKTVFDDLLKKRLAKGGINKRLSEAELKALAESVVEKVKKLAEVDLGTKTNAMIEKSTTLKTKVVELQFDKWTIKKGTPGGGSTCDKAKKTIVIDPNDSEEDIATGLAHETGHATFTPPPAPNLAATADGETFIIKSIEREFIDEGNAQFVACKVVAELKAKGTATVAPADQGGKFQALYDKVVAGTMTQAAATKEMAKEFLNLITSNTGESYFVYYGNHYMAVWNSAKPAAAQIAALPAQNKLFA